MVEKLDLLKKFETELRLRGLSENTIRSYILHINLFFNYNQKDITSLDEEDIKNYLSFLIANKKYAPKSLNLVKASLRYFFHKIVNMPLLINIQTTKVPKRLPQILTKEEVNKLLASIKNFKHRLIIGFMYSLGLRVSEVVNLKINDIDFDRNFCFIREGKGNKERAIPLPESIIKKLRLYLPSRDMSSVFLFYNKQGNKITTRSIERVVSEAAEKIKLGKRVYPHMLRASFATHMLEAGLDIRYVQHILGHENLDTTKIYTKVTSHADENIRRIMGTLYWK